MENCTTIMRGLKKWLIISSLFGIIANITSLFLYIGEGTATWGNFRTYKGYIGVKFSVSLFSDNNSLYKIYLKDDNPVHLIFYMIIASLITNTVLIILCFTVFHSKNSKYMIIRKSIKVIYILVSLIIAILHSYSLIIFNNTKDNAFHLLFRLYDNNFNSSLTYGIIIHLLSIFVILLNNYFINTQNDYDLVEENIPKNYNKLVEKSIVPTNEMKTISYSYII